MSDIYIDKNSVVQSKKIGSMTKIWQYCVVLSGAKIGKNVNINSHCFVENDVEIGDNSTIKCGVYLWDGIKIEDGVQVSPNVTFTNDKYPRAKSEYVLMRTVVKEGASIGAASVILGGVIVGKYSMIGAGSLIAKDVPDYALVYGNPATIHGYVCECSEKLIFDGDQAVCEKQKCGKTYIRHGDIVSRLK